MPRSSSSVRANEAPRKCRFSVESTSHQPSGVNPGIAAEPPGKNSEKKKALKKIRNCDRRSLK